MIYTTNIVQFNNLVINNCCILDENTLGSANAKVLTSEYNGLNGDYILNKNKYLLYSPQSITVDITLDLSDIDPQDHTKYITFAKTELSKFGKLWAYRHGYIMWAKAYVNILAEENNRKQNIVIFTADITLYEGIWHIADWQTTRLLEYDIESYIDTLPDIIQPSSFQYTDGCDDKITSYSTQKNDKIICGEEQECVCDEEYGTALGILQSQLDQMFNDKCFSYMIKEANLSRYSIGQLITGGFDKPLVSGQIYNKGSLPTSNYKISIEGSFDNPSVIVNGNEVIYKNVVGKGILDIYDDGIVEFTDCDGIKTVIPLLYVLPSDSYQGRQYVFNPGNNEVVIYHGTGDSIKAYIQLDEITT